MRKHRSPLSALLAAALCLGLLSVGAMGSEEPEEMPESTVTEAAEDEGPVSEPEEEPAGEPDADGAPPSKPPDGGPGGPGGTDGPGGPGGTDGPGGPGGPGGGGSGSASWSGASTITSGANVTGESYSSSTDQQNALLIDTKDEVTLADVTATKTGAGANSDNYSFYGINAAIMVKGGTKTTITGGTVNTTAEGANGVFSYGGNGGQNGASGDGTTVIIRDTKITTTAGGSGGIMTTGGGVTYAYDLDVTTGGQSSAAIRTDRGGGTVVVDGGRYVTTGLGSPAIYSTADITVKNATLISELSEGVCIEGKNSITLENCDLTANNTRMNGDATFLDTIMIYQSFSGDSSVGGSTFTMTGGSLTNKNGHVFHVTNTTATINLSGVKIINENAGADKTLLSVCADGWSGADNIATLNADGQILEGDILVGSDSTLTMNLKNGSVYTGSFSGVITNYKGTKVSSSIGTVNVTLDGTSKMYLQADAYVKSFSGDPANVITNGHTLYVNGKALAGTTDSEPEIELTPPVAAAYLAKTKPVLAAQVLRFLVGRG